MFKYYMFGASWCCNCRTFKGVATDLGYEYIDVDKDCSDAIERYRIRVLPTFIITDGESVKRLEQPSTHEELYQFTKQLS